MRGGGISKNTVTIMASHSTRLFSPAASQIGGKKEGVAALPDDEDALHDWMDKFNSRIKQKEADRDRKNEIQWAKHSQEIAAVHERRQREKMEEQLQQQREEEEAELRAQEAAKKEAFEERVATMTADLSAAERERWIEDDEAISKLERELEERTSRMDKAGVEANEWMAGYEARIKAQEDAAAAEVREAEEAHAAFLNDQANERFQFEQIALASRRELEEQQEVEERAALAVKEADGILIAEEKARVNMYNAVSDEQRKMLDDMPAEKRKATLDDLREIDALSQGVKRIAPGAATSGTTIAIEDHGVVRYLWDSVKVGAPEVVLAGEEGAAGAVGMMRGCTLTSTEDGASPHLPGSAQASCNNSPLKFGDCLQQLSPGQLYEQEGGGAAAASSTTSSCNNNLFALEAAIVASNTKIESLKHQLLTSSSARVEDAPVVAVSSPLSAEEKMHLMEEVIAEQTRQLALVKQLQSLQQHQQQGGPHEQIPSGGPSPNIVVGNHPTTSSGTGAVLPYPQMGSLHYYNPAAGQESRASLLSVVTPITSEGSRSREGSI